MDRKNFALFIGILIVMSALVQLNMSERLRDVKEGRPTVSPPFTDNDYTLSVNDNGVIVNLSDELTRQYGGIYLAVYAYDENGNYITKLKRVVDGKIVIGRDESADFMVKFDGNLVTDIGVSTSKKKFYQILDEAMKNSRNYGLGRCLLGRQGERICPVKAIILIRDDSPEGRGRIIPKINLRNGEVEGPNVCIEDGWCSSVCPTALIHIER
ncbi:MAG TPA: hypothetical protein EYP86_04170 [Candidatus Altiarchaeales archaeon]|nr:hypothetical protein [Candidatus Altiarchaeales archaeon]